MTAPETTPDGVLPTTDCTICTHAQAAAIDAGLLAGTSVRATAETYGLSRSSVGRHRQNHLTAQAITEPADRPEVQPLQLVDVHGRLTNLVERLEQAVELATRTRKAQPAVQAMREQRGALEAIAKIQADPHLQAAASLQRLHELIEQGLATWLVELIDFLGSTAGLQLKGSSWAHVVAECLRVCGGDVRNHDFRSVDTSVIEKEREGQALAEARRLEAEVQRRVAAELERRGQVLAIEAGPGVRVIEAGAS